MKKKNVDIRMLAEAGIMIALAMILSTIVIYQAPQGGSVTAGSMVPIMIFAIRWGTGPGILVGVAYGILHFIFKPSFFHWAQFILDYILAYGALGLAGIAHSSVDGLRSNNHMKIILVSVVSIGLRAFAHVLSGVIFFVEYAGSQNPWIYSIIYNATYLIPEMIISGFVLILIWKPLQRANIN